LEWNDIILSSIKWALSEFSIISTNIKQFQNFCVCFTCSFLIPKVFADIATKHLMLFQIYLLQQNVLFDLNVTLNPQVFIRDSYTLYNSMFQSSKQYTYFWLSILFLQIKNKPKMYQTQLLYSQRGIVNYKTLTLLVLPFHGLFNSQREYKHLIEVFLWYHFLNQGIYYIVLWIFNKFVLTAWMNEYTLFIKQANEFHQWRFCWFYQREAYVKHFCWNSADQNITINSNACYCFFIMLLDYFWKHERSSWGCLAVFVSNEV
jgi:hypothetical protein